MEKSNRRKFLGTAALVAGATVASASTLTDMDKKHPMAHHVFFWLKNPDSKEDRAKLIAGIKKLAKIETVGSIHVGVPAGTEQRGVVDNSWSVSELIFFSDLKGEATYQTHPLHVEFVETCSPLWEKVIVYDAMEA